MNVCCSSRAVTPCAGLAYSERRLNVLDVEHHRVGLKLGVDKVAVMMTLETRDQSHRDEAVRALRDAGFDVQPVE